MRRRICSRVTGCEPVTTLTSPSTWPCQSPRISATGVSPAASRVGETSSSGACFSWMESSSGTIRPASNGDSAAFAVVEIARATAGLREGSRRRPMKPRHVPITWPQSRAHASDDGEPRLMIMSAIAVRTNHWAASRMLAMWRGRRTAAATRLADIPAAVARSSALTSAIVGTPPSRATAAGSWTIPSRASSTRSQRSRCWHDSFAAPPAMHSKPRMVENRLER